jgi:hypothetical protein
MSKVIVYGNGKSRLKYDDTIFDNVITWGCNAIYRDMKVDNLVSVDYGAQHEIYTSGYAKENNCWFLDWNILPREFTIMGSTFNLKFKNFYENEPTENGCVINGKPNDDLYTTWIDDVDKVSNIDYPREWCSGATAIHLACQQGAKELFLLGFDLSINNIYEGTKNYPKQIEHPEWKQQLCTTFREFGDTEFFWVEPQHSVESLTNFNLKYITYDTFKHTIT